MKAVVIRALFPENGGVEVEMRGVDERGNPTYIRFAAWAGQAPPRA